MSGLLVEDAPLTHRVQLPAASGPHPTVLMLHGRSGDENVMWVFARALPPEWLALAPRAIHPDPEGGYAWLHSSRHPRKRDEWPTLAMFDDAVEAILNFIHILPTRYNADLNRLYLMGFSQGAATAYALALQHPTLVKGVAGLVGFAPLSPAGRGAGGEWPRPIAGLSIFAAIGLTDPLIPLEIARAGVQTLRAAGATVDAREYATGHKLNAQGMRDLRQWWAAR